MDHDISAGYCWPPRQKLKTSSVSSPMAEQSLCIWALPSALSHQTHLTSHVKSLCPALWVHILYWTSDRGFRLLGLPPELSSNTKGNNQRQQDASGITQHTGCTATHQLCVVYNTPRQNASESCCTLNLGISKNKGISSFGSNYRNCRSPTFEVFIFFCPFLLHTHSPIPNATWEGAAMPLDTIACKAFQCFKYECLSIVRPKYTQTDQN